MKQIACLYCEGTDAKLAVLSRDKDGIKIHSVGSLTMSRTLQSATKQDLMAELDGQDLASADQVSFDNLDTEGILPSSITVDDSDVGQLDTLLADFKLNNLLFIPVVTEPTINFHTYEGQRDTNKKKLIENVIKDLQTTKGIEVSEDLIDVFELNEKSMLGVFIEGDISCVGLINQLANYNKKRYLKIPTIKTAELSLAYYVSKSTKFFPEDYSLIVYIGKEYSLAISDQL